MIGKSERRITRVQLWLVRYNRRSNKSTRCRICSSQRYENEDTTHRNMSVSGWFKQSYTKLREPHYITLLTAVQAFRFFFPDINLSFFFFHFKSTTSSASWRSRQTLALIVSMWIRSFTVANMAISQRQNNLCTLATSSYVLPQFICVLFFDTKRYLLRPKLAKIFGKSKWAA